MDEMRTAKTTLIALAALIAVGCDQSGASNPAAAGGASGTGGNSAQDGSPPEPRPVLSGVNHYIVPAPTTSLTPMGQAGGSSGGAGGQMASGGSGGVPSAFHCMPNVPVGTGPAVAVCGDGFVTVPEQCDDGNKVDGDACSASCLVTPSLIAPRAAATAPPGLPGRELQLGRHPLGVGCNSVGVGFVDRSTKPAALKLATYDRVGAAKAVVGFGSADVDRPSPSLVALPDDTFVVAWTAFDSDELGIQLRRVDPSAAALEHAIVANEGQSFSQREPDVVFDGRQIVVAWTDDSDPVNGPDLRYRTFTPDLLPTSHDLPLAATSAVEGNVALASMDGAWAAAWRSGSNGMETVEVQSGATHWSVGPFLPSGSDDRPALVFLDASHLALALTEGSDPNQTGTASVSRLHGAILNAGFPGTVESFSIPQTVAPWANVPGLSQSQPTLVAMSDRLVVGWRTSLVNGNASGDELWTRELKWSPGPSGTLVVDTSSPDLPMVGAESRRDGDQSQPALLSSLAWPGHSLVSVWQDSGKTFGAASGRPDVALQFSQVQSTCTGVTLASDNPATYDTLSQYAVLGQKLVWTATGACHGAAQYRFVMQNSVGVWTVVQEWSSSNTYTWDTTGLPLGFYDLQVWVRDQPFSSYQAYVGKAIMLNDAPSCTGGTLVTDRSPRYFVTGEVSHWTATANCGGTPRYKFWVLEPGANSYVVAQDWSSKNTFDLDTTGKAIGYGYVSVWITNAAFYNNYQTTATTGFMQNTYAACTSATLVSDDGDRYAVPGQIVKWTATANCAGPAEYRFVFDNPAGVWTEVQGWSSNNTFTWDTTGKPIGFWNVQVWVRDAPFYNDEQAYGPSWFILNPSPACTTMTATATPSTVVSGALVTLHSSAVTCTTSEFEIYHYGPGISERLSPYSASNADLVWNSAGAAAGTHAFLIYARTQGSTQTLQVYTYAYVSVTAP